MQFKKAGEFIVNKLSKELPNYLSYHSIEHTLDVFDAANEIGKQEKLSSYEMNLVLTAAWYHDAGFVKAAKDHEEESCRIAKAVLPEYSFTLEEVERICNMIMATKIPQQPANHLEEILADADLDYLGRDDFFSIGDKLFQELSYFQLVNTMEEWNRLQLRFLDSHHYFTKTALARRQTKKLQNMELIKAKLNNDN